MSLDRVPILRHGLTQWDKTLISPAEVQHRLARVRSAMREQGVEVLLAYSDQAHSGDVGFLTNFQVFDPRMPAVALVTDTLLEAVIKVASRDMQFLSPHLWCPGHPCDFVTGNLSEKVLALASEKSLRNKSIGIAGGAYMSSELSQSITDFFGAARIKPIDGMLALLRRQKSPAERVLLRLATSKAEATMAAIARHVVPGITERSLAAFADYTARKAGAQEVEFLIYGQDDPPSEWPKAHFPFRPAEARLLSNSEVVGVLLALQFHGYWVEVSESLCTSQGDYDRVTALALGRACFEDALADIRTGELQLDAWQQAPRRAWLHGVGLDREEAPYVSQHGDRLLHGDIAALHVSARCKGTTVFFGRPLLVRQDMSIPLWPITDNQCNSEVQEEPVKTKEEAR